MLENLDIPIRIYQYNFKIVYSKFIFSSTGLFHWILRWSPRESLLVPWLSASLAFLDTFHIYPAQVFHLIYNSPSLVAQGGTTLLCGLTELTTSYVVGFVSKQNAYWSGLLATEAVNSFTVMHVVSSSLAFLSLVVSYNFNKACLMLIGERLLFHFFFH